MEDPSQTGFHDQRQSYRKHLQYVTAENHFYQTGKHPVQRFNCMWSHDVPQHMLSNFLEHLYSVGIISSGSNLSWLRWLYCYLATELVSLVCVDTQQDTKQACKYKPAAHRLRINPPPHQMTVSQNVQPHLGGNELSSCRAAYLSPACLFMFISQKNHFKSTATASTSCLTSSETSWKDNMCNDVIMREMTKRKLQLATWKHCPFTV